MAKKKIDIPTAYTSYVLEKGQRPPSVKAFADSLKMDETAFYREYSGFEAIEQALFLSYLEETLEVLQKDETYASYNSREKVLALFFTWLETLKGQRSLVVFMDRQQLTPFGSAYVGTAQPLFVETVRQLIREGIDQGEIADRWFVPRTYRNALWWQALMVLNYWIKDTSNNFEKTDVLVEKSVNFFFDVIEPNALDSGFDLVKFLFKD